MSIPYNNELDIVTHKWVTISNLLFEKSIKPSPNEVIFIDVSKSKYLIPDNADSSENDIVVNRKYLTKLFNFIGANNNNVRYVITDIVFDIQTPDDDSLISSIKALRDKFTCINTYSQDDYYQSNILGLPSATASITAEEGVIHKIPYLGKFDDTLLPMKIYHDVYNIHFRKNIFFTWFDNKGISFNSQINYQFLRKNDFLNGEYVKIGLGELVSLIDMSPNLFTFYLKNRYLIIGDFENDIVQTYLNEQPGSLVLFNAYLHLKSNNQILSIWYLIFLFSFIYFLLWLHFSKKEINFLLKLKIKFLKPITVPINIISITFLIISFNFLSYFIFGVNISLFHLVAIFSLIEFLQFIVGKYDSSIKG